jgi:hypothetical protein
MAVAMSAFEALCNTPPGPANAAKVFPATSFLTQRETWAGLAVALVLIVNGTLFLVTAGYNAEQITPALGLLGTVAGYMLGRGDREIKKSSDDNA